MFECMHLDYYGTKDQLEKVNAHLVGAVLTNAQVDTSLQYT